MQNKTLLIVAIVAIALGFVLVLGGSLFKIMHWPGSTLVLIGGVVMTLVAFILFIIYVVQSRKK